MSAPVLNGPFRMPMFHDFVPHFIRPWIYVMFAIMFQLSGGVYLGALNEIIGGTSLMREDILMCMYANLTGMAVYFPLLFRMKFRFTNKTLLLGAAVGVLLCNFAAMHIRILPLLWGICFIEGCCKIQGTFECMSNIQLWITPRRDFTVFFPVLHIIILCCIQTSDWLSAYLAHHAEWQYMYLFVVGLFLIMLILLLSLIKHVRIMRKLPLYGIDWLGAVLWATLLLQIAYLLDYGDWYNWWDSSVIRHLTISIIITTCIIIGRMFSIRHPFIEPKMWSYRHLLPVLLLITIAEMLLAAEYVPEEVFFEEGMHYGTLTNANLNIWMIAGVLLGCIFSLLWMKVLRFNYLRLLAIGFASLSIYLMLFYFRLSPHINIEQLYLPTIFRGFSYAVLSATFMTCLEEIMTFQHFFQSLCVFNTLHMVVGGVAGCAIYAQGLRYYIADSISRYSIWLDHTAFSRVPFHFSKFMEEYIVNAELVSTKLLYGWAAYIGIGVTLLFLLYETPIRSTLKKIPSWRSVGRQIKKSLSRKMQV